MTEPAPLSRKIPHPLRSDIGVSGREKAVAGAIEHYREFLIGRDPFAIGAIWQEMYRSQYFEGGRVLLRRSRQSISRCTTSRARRSACRCISCSAASSATTSPLSRRPGGPCGPEMIEQAKELMAMGWSAIRLFPAGHENRDIYEPRQSIAETAQMVRQGARGTGRRRRAGRRLPPPPVGGGGRQLSARRCRRGTLDFLEEPIRDETPEAYEALRRMTDVPFAIGEEFASKWQFLPYIERDIHQFNRIDVCNVGGLTEAMKVAGWSEAHYVDMMPHNPLGPICTAATLHFAAAVANFSWLETRATPGETHHGFDDAGIFPVQPRLNGAVYEVPRCARPRRRGGRGAGQEAELQVLGSAASHAHRRLRHQLVAAKHHEETER